MNLGYAFIKTNETLILDNGSTLHNCEIESSANPVVMAKESSNVRIFDNILHGPQVPRFKWFPFFFKKYLTMGTAIHLVKG
jgi:hypothetical protein